MLAWRQGTPALQLFYELSLCHFAAVPQDTQGCFKHFICVYTRLDVTRAIIKAAVHLQVVNQTLDVPIPSSSLRFGDGLGLG